jgi:aminoglycoside phosphotransferase (APT) family kinase protein
MSEKDNLDQRWQRAVTWIEKELGGVVLNAKPQGRWRYAWFFNLKRGAEELPMYFRGHRPGLTASTDALKKELNVLRILGEHGIPVPRIYGLCPDPEGIVMECCPGRPNLATAESQQERETVLNEYMDALVAMHAIDVAVFEQIGMNRPRDAGELAFGDLGSWETMYRNTKNRPEPLIEFTLRWLRQNIPEGRTRCTFLHGDTGQFLFDQGHLTTLLDLEFAYLGDPAADLAGLKIRDISEPLGDLRRAYQRYEEKTGIPVDQRVVDYHTVRFGVMTPLPIAHVCANPPPGFNLPQFLGWYLVYGRVVIEMIAHVEGVDLEEPRLPEPAPSRYSPSHRALSSILQALLDKSQDDVTSYELDTATRLATHLQRIEELAPELDADDVDELARLLGYLPENWQAADQALEAFVLSAQPERYPDIVRYLYRHSVRQQALLGPALREMEGSVLQKW